MGMGCISWEYWVESESGCFGRNLFGGSVLNYWENGVLWLYLWN